MYLRDATILVLVFYNIGLARPGRTVILWNMGLEICPSLLFFSFSA